MSKKTWTVTEACDALGKCQQHIQRLLTKKRMQAYQHNYGRREWIITSLAISVVPRGRPRKTK